MRLYAIAVILPLLLSVNQAMAQAMPGTQFDGIQNQAIDQNRVVPLVKGSREVNALPPGLRQGLAIHPLTDALYVMLAEDMGGSFRYLRTDQIDRLGWTGDDEQVRPLINLVKLLPRFQVRGSEGFYMIIAGGNYEASLLLATPLWSNLKKKLKGEPVVGIPNRDLFFVTGSEDHENLADLRKVVEDSYKNGTHPVSAELFMVGADGYTIFKGK